MSVIAWLLASIVSVPSALSTMMIGIATKIRNAVVTRLSGRAG